MSTISLVDKDGSNDIIQMLLNLHNSRILYEKICCYNYMRGSCMAALGVAGVIIFMPKGESIHFDRD